ncbi:hypothetical protein PENSPDRAFT_181420 [Peniophora sp. CONT]|nr:hypothetical protein PENSPDRAFT_181420 [Peniophora sp. CONT]
MPPAMPILDTANPLFTPSQPARAFLATLPGNQRARPEQLHRASFFARLLTISATAPGSRTSSIGSPFASLNDAHVHPSHLHSRLSTSSNSSAESANSTYSTTGSTSDAESDASAYMHAPAPRPKRNASALDNNVLGSSYSCARVPAVRLGKRTYASFEASDDAEGMGERPGKLLRHDGSGESGTLAESSLDSEGYMGMLGVGGKSQPRVNGKGTRFELRIIRESLDITQHAAGEDSADEESLGLGTLRDAESSPATAAALLPLLAHAFPGTGLAARIDAAGASSLQDVADLLGRDGMLRTYS